MAADAAIDSVMGYEGEAPMDDGYEGEYYEPQPVYQEYGKRPPAYRAPPSRRRAPAPPAR